MLHKDAFEDVDLGDEGTPKKVDRSTLGNCLVVLGECREPGTGRRISLGDRE